MSLDREKKRLQTSDLLADVYGESWLSSKKSPSPFMRGKNDDGDSWKPFENGILTLVNPKQNIFFGSIIEIVSLGGSAFEDSPISGLSQL
jgi:hypothetical protein